MIAMTDKMKKAALEELKTIPGVGNKISEELWRLGLRSVEDLDGRDPQELYEKLSIRQGMPVDRCVLYVLRCAVYYASNDTHDPELLKWWNWKDG